MQDDPDGTERSNAPDPNPADPAATAAAPPPPPAAPAAATGGTKPLPDRVRDILLHPEAEWAVIEAEPSTIGGIYRSYVAILAAIPPIALMIGLLLLAGGYFYAYSAGSIVTALVVRYLLALAGVYLVALVIDALAPTFGGTKDQLRAFKLSAYSTTPAWVAGVLLILPSLWIVVTLASLYGIYLLYLGVPRLMRVPQDRAIPFVAVTFIAAIVVVAVIDIIVRRIMWGF